MDEENASSTNSIKLELSVYMHCDACERSVRQVIKNTGGVDKVEVDREENKVTVTGDFDPEKVVKRIKKRTGKKAEVLVPEEEEDGGGGEGEGADASHESCRHGGARHYAYVPRYYQLVPAPPPPDTGGGAADAARDLQRHDVMRHYACVPYYYDLVSVPPDSGGGVGGGDGAHEFQRHGMVGHYAYDLVPVPPDNGGGGVAHELQRPARSDWDLHSFDDENTQACRVM
ncbi:uncharacterized protein LOC102700141 [Oryza brachyantha]|uniref:uncharacterized protein LOC102700141 n=1 Tax=Oryza brachyantha TaxID=4533 RepID=UPI0007765632|nr:uncharacterized protein LOC102700141 [Oryza brachyantha]